MAVVIFFRIEIVLSCLVVNDFAVVLGSANLFEKSRNLKFPIIFIRRQSMYDVDGALIYTLRRNAQRKAFAYTEVAN